MSRRQKPGAKATRQLHLKLPAEDVDFLREGLGLPDATSAVRALVSAVRSWGSLPAPVVDRLARDAAKLKLKPLEYVRLALHQRYEQITNRKRRR